MTEKPKARLTIEQHQQAINEAIWIDASPHEWPTLEKVPLLCNALLDSVVMVDYFMKRLAAVEAERDAARERVKHCETRMMRYAMELAEMQAERDAAQAGEARAVEALQRCHEGAARQLAEPRDHDNDQYSLTAIATDCEVVLAAQRSALSWLAQQRREAAAEENDRWANEWWEFPRPDSLTASDFITRAAALRAGEVGNE